MSDTEVQGSVLRLPMVYGPGDPLHRFFPLLKRFADGRSSILLPDDFASWRGPRGYVENVAHAIALAATSEQAAGRIYNICEEPSLSELEWQTSLGSSSYCRENGRQSICCYRSIRRSMWSPAQSVFAPSWVTRSG